MKIVVNGLMVLGLAVLGMLTGCSSMKVVTDYSEAVDFNQFRTFKYVNSNQNLASANQLHHRRVVDAINREMVVEGFVEVDADPDVFVTYFAGVDKQVILNTTGMAHGRGGGWHRSGMMHTSTTTATTVHTGTLVIDIWDAGSDELVWRGQVSDTITKNPEQIADSINRGVTKVFERYPPK